MKFIRKYAMPYVLFVLTIGVPTLLIYYVWPFLTELEYSSWLTIIGLVMLIHFERHLWPILRDGIKDL